MRFVSRQHNASIYVPHKLHNVISLQIQQVGDIYQSVVHYK